MPGRSSSLVAITCSAIRRESDRIEERFKVVALRDDDIPITTHLDEPDHALAWHRRGDRGFSILRFFGLGRIWDQFGIITRLTVDFDLLDDIADLFLRDRCK